MKTLVSSTKEELSRDLYWIKVIFLSDDESKRTSVFACASQDYLDDYYRIVGDSKLEKRHLDEWVSRVIVKWSGLGEDILNQDIHYDVFANTQEGEANGLDVLLGKVQTS